MGKVKLAKSLPVLNCGRRCNFADKRLHFYVGAQIKIYQLHKMQRNAMICVAQGRRI